MPGQWVRIARWLLRLFAWRPAQQAVGSQELLLFWSIGLSTVIGHSVVHWPGPQLTVAPAHEFALAHDMVQEPLAL